jgi:hypothetical protein
MMNLSTERHRCPHCPRNLYYVDVDGTHGFWACALHGVAQGVGAEEKRNAFKNHGNQGLTLLHSGTEKRDKVHDGTTTNVRK